MYSNLTSSVQPLDLLPFAVTKARYKRWFNSSICQGEDYEIGDCMKELISIILKLENDIWLNAWKRSGLVADYLTELDCAESGILRGGPSIFEHRLNSVIY